MLRQHLNVQSKTLQLDMHQNCSFTFYGSLYAKLPRKVCRSILERCLAASGLNQIVQCHLHHLQVTKVQGAQQLAGTSNRQFGLIFFFSIIGLPSMLLAKWNASPQCTQLNGKFWCSSIPCPIKMQKTTDVQFTLPVTCTAGATNNVRGIIRFP